MSQPLIDRPLRGIIAMLLAVAFFSAMDAGMKALTAYHSPMQITALRGALAWPLVVIWLCSSGAIKQILQTRWSLHLLRAASAGWTVPVLKVSALQHAGLDAFWADILRYRDTMQASGAWTARRSRQALDWMWTLVDQGLRSRFEHHAAVRAALPDIRAAVAAGTLPASAAALRLLQAMD